MATAGRLSPAIVRCLSTRSTTPSLRDPNPNWSNRPPKETILLDGCDFEHWLVVMEAPQGDITRDEIIDSYIKTLATVVGRSRNFERRRENLQNRDFQNMGPSPMPNQAGPNSGPGLANMGPPPPNWGPMSPNMGPPPPNRALMQPPNMGPPPPNRAPMPPPNMGPPNNYNNPQPSNNWNSGPPNSYNQAPPNNYNQMPSNNYNQMPPNNPAGVPPNNMAPPSNA
ncbi:unnamed protein product [Malus baccata var. baccata]